MKICLKAALGLMVVALSWSPITAQGDPPVPPQDKQQARAGFGPRGPMQPTGPDEERGGWGRGRGEFGEGHRRGHGGFGGGRREFGLGRLLNDPAIRVQAGITAEQVAKIRQQEASFRKTEIRGRADIEVKRIDLNNLLAADKPDRVAINNQLQEISAAKLALEKSAIEYRLNMRDAITPAQREKLRQSMRVRQRGGRGAGRKGQRGPAGGDATPPVPSSQAPQPNS
jgi:Heavy-metal resistance